MTQTQVARIPGIGEVFTITVDNTGDPMQVVTDAGFPTEGRSFLGPAVEGKNTYQVCLLDVGAVDNRDEALINAKAANPKVIRLLEGQACHAFKCCYPRHEDRPIVFGHNEWMTPGNIRACAYLLPGPGSGWLTRGITPNQKFRQYWLWAVVLNEAPKPLPEQGEKVLKVWVTLDSHELVGRGVCAYLKMCKPDRSASSYKDILCAELWRGWGIEGGKAPDIILSSSATYPNFEGPRLVFGQDFGATTVFSDLLRKIRVKLDLGPYRDSETGWIYEANGDILEGDAGMP